MQVAMCWGVAFPPPEYTRARRARDLLAYFSVINILLGSIWNMMNSHFWCGPHDRLAPHPPALICTLDKEHMPREIPANSPEGSVVDGMSGGYVADLT